MIDVKQVKLNAEATQLTATRQQFRFGTPETVTDISCVLPESRKGQPTRNGGEPKDLCLQVELYGGRVESVAIELQAGSYAAISRTKAVMKKIYNHCYAKEIRNNLAQLNGNDRMRV